MQPIKLKDLAEQLGAELVGDPEVTISGLNNIFDAKEGDITFLANPKYADKLPLCQASAVIVAENVEAEGINLLKGKNPRLIFGRLMTMAFPRKKENGKISPQAFIAESAKLGENVTIYPFAYIGENSIIGDNSTIYSNVFVDDNVTIGNDCLILAGSAVMHGSQLGNRVMVNANTVIGSEGYGFERDGEKHFKIPQVGNTIVKDDVEIGTLCAIDRGSMQDTVLEAGTKIDNFVHIGHNCHIGENNLFVAQTGLSGTVTTGKNVYFGGRAAVMDHIKIADRAMVGPVSVVTSDVEGPDVLFGYPARPYKDWTKASAMFYKTDDQRKKLQSLARRVEELEKELEEKENRSKS